MKLYAHTADGGDGQPQPECFGAWQPLSTHLGNVARLAKQFGQPFGLEHEAELAGWLHDLGKYRDEFQSYLRGERGSSVETQHAVFGAAWAAEDGRSLLAAALAVAGHHAGLHDCGDLQGMFAKPVLHVKETLPALIAPFEAELGPLPLPPSRDRRTARRHPSFFLFPRTAFVPLPVLFSVCNEKEKYLLATARLLDHRRTAGVENELGMTFYAHTAEDGGQWQPLATHLQNVSELAGRFGASSGLDNAARTAGLLHDLGKYRTEFQDYLRQTRAAGTETHHAIYGAALAFRQAELDYPHLLPAAFAVAGHHAGLPDVTDLRQNVEGTKYRTSERVPKLADLLESQLGKLRFDSSPGLQTAIENEDELALEFATRMIFAALVDADRLDTAHWPDAVPPERLLDAARLLQLVETARERKRKGSDDTDANRELNRLRNAVFDDCLAAAKLPPGFFSLTVPTGGGKTLAAMAFALAHAQACGLRRVIVVIPFLSIIEQNAKEYRRILGDDVVLEHHSAVPPRADAGEEENSAAELATENWDAPIVVTTSVQFLESLFADSPAKCRKLHRIAKSVVILDEVQTLPAHLLRPILDAFRRLQRDYGTSFVFCSATQPAFRKSPQLPEGFTENELRPIASNVPELFRKLRRVDYHIPKPDQPLDWPDLAARLAEEEQVLCVVNLRRHAATVWEEVRKKFSEMEKSSVFHLSSAMCAQHRLDVLDQVRELLKEGLPCRLVATQLIEAGVDVDFPAVWRAMGPLDSIVQVAGRCNREGRLPNGLRGQMHVFFPTDDGLPRDGLYQTATGFAASMLASLTPEELATNPDLFTRYFAMLHALPQEKAHRIQELRHELMFRKVAREAKVIEDDTRPVIVGYRNGADIVQEIQTRQLAPGEKRFDKRDLRNLQRYMVNVVRRDFDLLLSQKHLRELLPNLDLHVLKSGHYHPDLGLLVNRARPLEDYLQ